MTVCVAAVCEGGTIVAVSDRMITTGDIEFEPPQRKVWRLTPSISVMTAGDTTLQAEIMHDVDIAVSQRIVTEPQNWWRVRDVAELYRGIYQEIRSRRAESSILAPLGLDHDSFIANQTDMEPSLVASLVSELTHYSLSEVEAIFVGTDNDGPVDKKIGTPGIYSHIYVSHGGDVACYDPIGFAAIGIGAWHAQSQLMFAKHTRWRPFPETLLSVYSAKKHAEVAPGVGKETDMFSEGPGLGAYLDFGDHVIVELERVYQESRERINAVTVQAESDAKAFLQTLKEKTGSAQAATEAEAINPPNSSSPQQTTGDPSPPQPSPESR